MPDTSRFYNADQGPQAQPDVELPRRARQDVSASPSEFGGLEATGLKEAGTGATQAGEFFGQVAADQATNNFLDEATKIRGDFSNLRGQDAMNAWPGVQKQITDAFDRNRANLTLGSQEYYDRFSRRELVNNQDYMLNHYNQQQNEWQKTTNISTDATSNTAIASNPSDDHAFELNQQRMVDAAVKNAQHENGIDPSKPMTPDAQNIVNTASQDAKQRAILTRIQGVETTNPGLALSYLNKYRSDLGTKAPVVEERLKGYQKNAEDDAYIKKATATAAGGGAATPHGRIECSRSSAISGRIECSRRVSHSITRGLPIRRLLGRHPLSGWVRVRHGHEARRIGRLGHGEHCRHPRRRRA